MSSSHWKYVLVGGGPASSSAAVAIRQHDTEGSVLLIGQEVNRPYNRPPLSKGYLLGTQKRSDLFTLGPEWFVEHHVELRTACRATRLDAARHAVTLSSGEEVGYEKLLMATGGTSRLLKIPGCDLPNVFYLRSAADADRLKNATEKARQEGKAHQQGRGRVVVVGAGLLGTELAATFTQLGLAVDVLSLAAHPWARLVGDVAGRVLSGFLESRGVRVHANTSPMRLEGDGRVQRVITSSGQTLECDVIVPAIGMVPQKQLLRGTALAAEQAILVDSRAATSDPDIYAAGDCAAIFDPLFGKYRLLDHSEGAISMGTLAGSNMAGAERIYDAVSSFSSEVFGIRLAVWGEAKLVERRIVRGNQNPEAPDFIEIGVDADGRVAQVLSAGHGGEDDVLRDLVRKRVSVEGRESLLRDPSADLAAALH